MTTKAAYKTTFEVDEVIRPIYTGGAVALDNGSRILATTLGEDAVLTDLATGKLFAKIEGVRSMSSIFTSFFKVWYSAANTVLLGWRIDLDTNMYVLLLRGLAS